MTYEDVARSGERLLAGVRQFQRDVYPQRRAAYEQAARNGQQPHSLFITCADSRIDPELITQSGPGEIFVSRNIGNIVLAYSELSDDVSAIIEYAVSGLKVSRIVVCGHSDCGAMIGLLHPMKVAKLPIVRAWLRNASSALSNDLRERFAAASGASLLDWLVEANVLVQLERLRTHPSVAHRLAQGTLALSGWVYDIALGTVRVYDEKQRRFSPVTCDEQVATATTIR